MALSDTAGSRPAPPRDPRQPADFDPVAESKRLLRTIRSGALATLQEGGAPFATLTAFATDCDGAPVLLLSWLAAHTRNLERDPRCSLLLAQSGRGDPLAHPRLTLSGTAARIADPRSRARFLRRNPKAELYADFPDFSFWRVEIGSVHLNGGFARAADFGPETLLTRVGGAEALLAAEEDILAHLNADHAETLALLARACGTAGRTNGEGEGGWRASGLDPEGLDLLRGDASARVSFPRRAETPLDVRDLVADMAKAAREGA
jgi:putative heme iron utilization protein